MNRNYDNSKRKERARLRALARTLRDIERLENPRPRSYDARARRLEAGFANDAETPAQRDKRLRLEALPADRVCPVCGKVKLKSRMWVVDLATGEALCLSCARQIGP